MRRLKISDLKFKLLVFKPELADYLKLAQKIDIFACTALLASSIWAGLPLAFLLFIDIEVRDEFDES